MLHGLFWTCLLMLIGVMGWLSYSMLQAEQRRLDETAQIRLVEQSRLALWRMDSLLSSMLAAENNRAPGEYVSIVETKEEKDRVGGLPDVAAFARLYFQIDPDGALSSPQTGKQRRADMAHMVDGGAALWLRGSLAEIPQPAPIPKAESVEEDCSEIVFFEERKIGRLFDGLLQGLYESLVSAQDLKQVSQDVVASQTRQRADASAIGGSDKNQKALQQGVEDYNLRRQLNNNNQLNINLSSLFSPGFSVTKSVDIKWSKGRIKAKEKYGRPFPSSPVLMRKTAEKVEFPLADLLKKDVAVNPVVSRQAKEQEKSSRGGSFALGPEMEGKEDGWLKMFSLLDFCDSGMVNGLSADFFRNEARLNYNADGMLPDMQDGMVTLKGTGCEVGYLGETASSADYARLSISAFQPKWYRGRDCFLIRSVIDRGQVWMQGIWLDWPKLSAYLLQSVRDILPGASLEPDAGREESYLTLASIPAVLNPGSLPVAPGEGLETVWKSIIMSWACGGLALCGVIGLIVGMLRLSERRAVFVSAVTHELRTPLTTFNMYTEMLSSGLVPRGKEMSYMDILKHESCRLTHLVDNVLSYARVEKNSVALHPEAVPVTALASAVMARITPRLAGVDMDSQMCVETELQTETALVDVTAVEQIVYNLADNAAKYARAPGSVLRLSMVREKRFLVLRVEDEGQGIPEALKGRLFRPFSRSAEEAAGKQPGVGLGLALSRELARKMGGELWLEASSGCGCRFAMKLPLVQ